MNSDFAVATHCLLFFISCHDRSIISSDELAKSICVHPVRVRKMLSLLRKEQYIGSKEGAKGGFYLVADPSTISLADLYRLTSRGTLQPKCPQQNERCLISRHIEDVLQMIFHQAEEQVEDFLQGFSVQDVYRFIEQKHTNDPKE